jgi:hypothetical protein
MYKLITMAPEAPDYDRKFRQIDKQLKNVNLIVIILHVWVFCIFTYLFVKEIYQSETK